MLSGDVADLVIGVSAMYRRRECTSVLPWAKHTCVRRLTVTTVVSACLHLSWNNEWPDSWADSLSTFTWCLMASHKGTRCTRDMSM